MLVRENKVYVKGISEDSQFWQKNMLSKFNIDYHCEIDGVCPKDIDYKNTSKFELIIVTPEYSPILQTLDVLKSSLVPSIATVVMFASKVKTADGKLMKFENSQIEDFKQVLDAAFDNGAIICDEIQDVITVINDYKNIKISEASPTVSLVANI